MYANLPLPPPDTLPRGVYYEPWVGPRGERYVVAINRRGERVLEATILPGADSMAATTDLLWTILDREDPEPPGLQVVA